MQRSLRFTSVWSLNDKDLSLKLLDGVLCFPNENMGHMEVSVRKAVSYSYKSDSSTDECKVEVVLNEVNDYEENYDTQCLFCTGFYSPHVSCKCTMHDGLNV